MPNLTQQSVIRNYYSIPPPPNALSQTTPEDSIFSAPNALFPTTHSFTLSQSP